MRPEGFLLKKLLCCLGLIIGFALTLAACSTTKSITGQATAQRASQTRHLEQILQNADNRTEGNLEIRRAHFALISSNIAAQRWRAVLSVRNNAPISSNCSASLKVFDSAGELLEEYLLFNDTIHYEDTATFSGEIFIKRIHNNRISKAEYRFNCIKKGVLGH